jgi:hypothetical protein
MFRKLSSLQAYLLIAIALGVAGLHSVPSFQVASSTDDRCNDAGGTINETGACVLPPASTEPQCPKDWVYEPEMGRCAPGPPIFELAPGNPASGDNADNGTQVEDGS